MEFLARELMCAFETESGAGAGKVSVTRDRHRAVRAWSRRRDDSILADLGSCSSLLSRADLIWLWYDMEC